MRSLILSSNLLWQFSQEEQNILYRYFPLASESSFLYLDIDSTNEIYRNDKMREEHMFFPYSSNFNGDLLLIIENDLYSVWIYNHCQYVYLKKEKFMITDKNAISYKENYKETRYEKLFSLIVDKAYIINSKHQKILDKLNYPEEGFWCALMNYRAGLEEESYFDTSYSRLEEENDDYEIFEYCPIEDFTCNIIKIKNQYYVHSSQILITALKRIKLWKNF